MEHDATADVPHRHPEHAGHSGHPRHRHAVLMDRIVTSDLGLGRLRLAVQTGLALGLVMLGEWLLIHYSHALQVQVSLPAHEAVLPPAMAAKVAAVAAKVALQHHAAIVVAMLFGCYVTVVAAGAIPSEDVRGQVAGLAAMAPPFVGGIALALKADDNRTLSLALMVVLVGAGTYALRWGGLALIAGAMVTSGFFFGYLLRALLTESDLGWVTAETGIGLGACLLVRLTLFYPSRIRAQRRFERSFLGCARLVADLIAEAVHTRGTVPARTRRRLERLLLRLNESALLLDARLGAVPGGRGAAATRLHEALFDAELALGDIARAVVSLDRASLAPGVHLHIGRAVAALRDDVGLARAEGEWLRQAGEEVLARAPEGAGDRIAWTGTALRRLGIGVQALAAALPRWQGIRNSAEGETVAQPLSSPVRLAGGWLQGSVMVSAVASARQPGRGARMHPALRLAIQVTVASAAALIAGDAVNPNRFYWAMIAVFVVLLGTYNVAEQVTKALSRSVGTLIGVLAGGLLAHEVGLRDGWAIAVVLIALTLAHYLVRVNYTFMIMGVTIAISQEYVQLDEFTNHLLVVRLEETAIGAGIAALVAALVVPLYTRRVLRVAAERHQAATAAIAERAAGRTGGHGSDASLRHAVRTLDDAHHAMLATRRSLRHLGLLLPAAARAARSVEHLSASYQGARTLLTDAELVGALGESGKERSRVPVA